MGFHGHQELAADVDEEQLDAEEEEDVAVVFKKETKSKKDVIDDMVGNIFNERKKHKNKKVERILLGLTVHPPMEISYRNGTGPDQLQQLEIGKPRYAKRR